ncbi:HtrA protease/chaperone protein [hydrothermal vent metagenome]|uniref:Probable periplasmic serine endoprotease DegP-like n=1 Tax=hydrothermal vent metagenome TaxID=652676 RepID=A0A3B0UGV8_9ZZZZ
MRSPIFFRSRKWLAATSLATVLALASTGLVISSQQTSAQVNVTVGVPASFADLVQAVKPSVVSIRVDGSQQVRRFNNNDFMYQFPDLPPDHPLRRFFDQFNNQRGNGNDKPQTRKFVASGSGFIISADGFVVTNNHVVENAKSITVVDEQGEEHVAELVGTDPRTDLALLRIKGAKNLPFVEFAKTDVRVGDWVVAVGNPFGLGGTVTAGIVSARGRDINMNSYGDFIQIDAAINKGNSGGPAFNLNGKVVGVNTAIFSPNGGNVGIAFAIPANIVQKVVSDLMKDGVVTRGFLGVSIQDVTPDIAKSIGLDTARGALVTAPVPNGPAGAAGIVSGDIILKVNGKAIDDTLDLVRTVAQILPNTKVDVTVWRNGKQIDYQVVLAKRQEQVAKAQDNPVQAPVAPPEPKTTSVGLALVPNDAGDGLLVKMVKPNSSAAEKGLVSGDVILEADNTPVTSSRQFEEVLGKVRASGRTTVLIKAQRNDNVRFIGLPL